MTNTLVITKTYHTSVPTTKTPSGQGSAALQTKAWLSVLGLDRAGQGNVDKQGKRRHNRQICSRTGAAALGCHNEPAAPRVEKRHPASGWAFGKGCSIQRFSHQKQNNPHNVPSQCILIFFFSSELTGLMDLFIYLYMCIKRQKLVLVDVGFLPIGKISVMRSRDWLNAKIEKKKKRRQ